MWRFLSFVALLLFLIVPASLAAGDKAHVLLLNSYHKGLQWTDEETRGVTEVINKSGYPIELHIEYMDTKRLADTTHFDNLSRQFGHKYRHTRFNAIITTDNDAFNFIKEKRRELFPWVPVIFTGVNFFKESMLAGVYDVTGVAETFEAGQTIDTMLRLHPNTRRIVVILDSTITGKAIRDEMSPMLSPYLDHVAFEFWDNIPLNHLRKKIPQLTQDTLILLMPFARDNQGIFIDFKDMAKLVSDLSPVPTYGTWDFFMGHGIVGGKLTHGVAQGRAAAKILLRILDGEKVENIPVEKIAPTEFQWDARQLQRFSINKDKLPPGSLILYQSLRQKYKSWIWLGGCIAVLMLLIIFAWIRTLYIKRQRDQELRQNEERFRILFDLSPDPAWIIKQNHFMECNQAAVDFLGYTDKRELSNTHPSALSPKHQPDGETSFSKAEQMMELAREKGIHRFEWVHKKADGSDFYAEVTLSSITLQGAPVIYCVWRDVTDRKLAEESLKNSQNRLQTLLNLASDGIHILDEKGNIVAFSQSFARMLGYSSEETAKLNVADWDAIIPQEQLLKLVHTLMDEPATFETIHRRRDGSIFDVEINAKGVILEGQKFLYSSSRDISKRKQAEEKIATLATIVESSSDAIISEDLNGIIQSWNHAAQTLFGFSADEAIGRSINTLIPEEGDIEEKALLTHIRRGNAVPQHQAIRQTRGGKTTPVTISVSPVRDKNDNIVGASKIIRDITDLQMAESELRENKERLEFIINGANLGTWDWNIATGDVIFNERWAAIIGYSLSELEPNVSTWEHIIHPDEAKEIMHTLTEHLEGNSPVYMTEHRLKHKSGKWVWVLDVGKVFQWNSDGEPMRAVGIHMDITKQKEGEEKLTQAMQEAQAANHAKSVFLSNMSHELRTPLNAILGYTQLFAADESLDTKQQSGIHTMHEAGEHLLRLINDILDVAKIEAGKLELVPGEIILEPFLLTIKEIIQVRSEAKGLECIYTPDPNLPYIIVADELRLRQILLNLLSNAVKFTDHGYCSLQVKSSFVSEEKTRITFIVEDSGPGISEDMLKKVFDPFQQSGERLKYSEGTGLGLTISSQLTKLMDGELALTSPIHQESNQKSGPGCRFVFSAEFPAFQNQQLDDTKEESSEHAITHLRDRPKKILIVDDRASNRLVLKDTLEAMGFDMYEVDEGAQVVAACEKIAPDLILMDLRMPVVDGFEATSQLRMNDKFSAIPVIAVTASASNRDALEAKCLQNGFKGFLTKPISIPDLLEVMRKHLELDLQ